MKEKSDYHIPLSSKEPAGTSKIDIMPEAFLEQFKPLVKAVNMEGLIPLIMSHFNWKELFKDPEFRKEIDSAIMFLLTQKENLRVEAKTHGQNKLNEIQAYKDQMLANAISILQMGKKNFEPKDGFDA